MGLWGRVRVPGDRAGCGDTPEPGRGDPAAGSATGLVPSAAAVAGLVCG